jgi:hypothetical protein
MKLWGNWFNTYDKPTDFRAKTEDTSENLSIKCMKVSHHFCIIQTVDDLIYSMGRSSCGALGIKDVSNT